MSAYQLGPVVLSAPRLYAALGLLVLVGTAEVVAWRARRAATSEPQGSRGPATAAWAWNAALAVFLGARLGFVIENLPAFLEQPLAILKFWQGGFSPWWGVGAGALVAAWSVARHKVRPRTAVVPAVLALATWLLVPALLSPAEQQARSLPSMTLERLEGGELDISELRGQPVVINMWATWCPPCRRELPMLAAAARTYPDVRFVFANQAEPRETVSAYLEGREDLELQGVVLDARGALAGRFGTIGLPTTLFFDAEGNHVLTHAGELSSVLMVNYLADLRRGDR